MDLAEEQVHLIIHRSMHIQIYTNIYIYLYNYAYINIQTCIKTPIVCYGELNYAHHRREELPEMKDAFHLFIYTPYNGSYYSPVAI
jgi:hypothetical protein